jgi:hypothetical protein
MYTLIEYTVCLLVIVACSLLFFGLSVLVIFSRHAALSLVTMIRRFGTGRLGEPKVHVRHAFQSFGPNNHLQE